MPNFHFKVKGHPIGFVIEKDSKNEALDAFNILSLDPISGIHGFSYHDVEKVSVVPEKKYYLLSSMKIY
jgi:hypothetical protein